MSTDLEIRNVVVVQGRGELAGQGRRWEYLTWDVLSWWDRVDKQHSLSGVIAAHSGSGSLEQNGHRAGQPQRRFSNQGRSLSSSSSAHPGFCYSQQEPSPVLGMAL